MLDDVAELIEYPLAHPEVILILVLECATPWCTWMPAQLVARNGSLHCCASEHAPR